VDARRDIDGLSEIDGHYATVSRAEERLHFVRGRTVHDQSDEPVGIEKRQRRRVAAASSFRALARRDSGDPSFPFRAPRAAAIGSSGNGRRMTWSPASSTETDVVPQRLRMLAGRDTWPPAVIFLIFIENIVLH